MESARRRQRLRRRSEAVPRTNMFTSVTRGIASQRADNAALLKTRRSVSRQVRISSVHISGRRVLTAARVPACRLPLWCHVSCRLQVEGCWLTRPRSGWDC